MLSLWEQFPLPVIGLLAVIDVALVGYTFKNLPKMFNQGPSPKKRKQLLSSIRKFKGPEDKLFEIKKLIDGQDEVVALYAYRAVVRQSHSVSLQMLLNVVFRSNGKKTLLLSCLKKTADINHQIIRDLMASELPDWIYIACLKVLAKVKAPELIPLLVSAQESSHGEIQKCATDILTSLEATKIEKISA